jgi:outer membrane protein
VGLGVNYTRISDVNVTVPATGGETTAIPLNLSRNSFGLAAQIGVDVPVGGGWLLNLDVKKVQIGADVKVKASGAKVGEFNVDPLLVSIGVGKRF